MMHPVVMERRLDERHDEFLQAAARARLIRQARTGQGQQKESRSIARLLAYGKHVLGFAPAHA